MFTNRFQITTRCRGMLNRIISIKVLKHCCISHTIWMINGRMSTQTYGGIYYNDAYPNDEEPLGDK